MYSKMTKPEKRKVRINYANTKRGRRIVGSLDRLIWEGLICIIIAVIIFFLFLFADLSVGYLVFAVIVLIFGIIFLCGQYIIRLKEYKRYLDAMQNRNINVKNKKKKLTMDK